MHAIVLAAGRGTRLGDLGRRMPKVLVDVGGRPLLTWQLELLAREGIERVVVNAHHLADQVEEFVAGYGGPLELACVVEPALLGTAGAARNALELLGPGPFLVVYGDVLVRDALAPLVEAHAATRPAATLAVHRAPSARGKGVVVTDRTGRITAFAEKSTTGEGPFLINSGVYVVEPALVAGLEPGTPSDFAQDVFPRALAEGRALRAHRFRRPVVDAGTPDGLAEARALVERR